jgi:hypothetical protein
MQIDGDDAEASQSIDVAGSCGTVSSAPPRPGRHNASLSVLSQESVCPPFKSCPNKNLFQQFFGIKFHHDDHTYVRAISTYEFSRCLGLVDNI